MSEMKVVGSAWGKAMRKAKSRDGEICGRCGERPSHQVVMVGIPTPGGLALEGTLAVCDECLEAFMAGEDSALAALDRKKEEGR